MRVEWSWPALKPDPSCPGQSIVPRSRLDNRLFRPAAAQLRRRRRLHELSRLHQLRRLLRRLRRLRRRRLGRFQFSRRRCTLCSAPLRRSAARKVSTLPQPSSSEMMMRSFGGRRRRRRTLCRSVSKLLGVWWSVRGCVCACLSTRPLCQVPPLFSRLVRWFDLDLARAVARSIVSSLLCSAVL